MKLLNEVKEILDRYNLEVYVPDGYKTVYKYENEHPIKVEENFSHETISDGSLYEKYSDNIPNGWYGFSIGTPTPRNWFVAIDNVLEMLVKKDKNFVIHQIKMKYGGIRFYCESDEIEDLFEIEKLFEKVMHSEKLIY